MYLVCRPEATNLPSTFRSTLEYPTFLPDLRHSPIIMSSSPNLAALMKEQLKSVETPKMSSFRPAIIAREPLGD